MPPVTTLTSREFNQDTSGAKKAAAQGPVFITDRGRPAHVLLSIAEYRRLTGGRERIADLLATSAEAADIGFEAPPLPDLPQAADLGERGEPGQRI
jgi:prevent-host-death family protein